MSGVVTLRDRPERDDGFHEVVPKMLAAVSARSITDNTIHHNHWFTVKQDLGRYPEKPQVPVALTFPSNTCR